MGGLRRIGIVLLGLAASVLTLPLWSASPLFGQVTILSAGPTARVTLSSADTTITQTSDTAWTLDNLGSLSGRTVTWQITATAIDTVPGQLVLQGEMTVANTGSGPATIGNIVVNLQTRVGNKWMTVCSDIADATQGDAAT